MEELTYDISRSIPESKVYYTRRGKKYLNKTIMKELIKNCVLIKRSETKEYLFYKPSLNEDDLVRNKNKGTRMNKIYKVSSKYKREEFVRVGKKVIIKEENIIVSSLASTLILTPELSGSENNSEDDVKSKNMDETETQVLKKKHHLITFLDLIVVVLLLI